jgi:hypothetical protein
LNAIRLPDASSKPGSRSNASRFVATRVHAPRGYGRATTRGCPCIRLFLCCGSVTPPSPPLRKREDFALPGNRFGDSLRVGHGIEVNGLESLLGS